MMFSYFHDDDQLLFVPIKLNKNHNNKLLFNKIILIEIRINNNNNNNIHLKNKIIK